MVFDLDFFWVIFRNHDLTETRVLSVQTVLVVMKSVDEQEDMTETVVWR